MRAEDAHAAVRLWRIPGVEVCDSAGFIWLRGAALDESLELLLRALPGARRFTTLPDGQLLAPSALVPRGWLPDGPWVNLRQWVTVEMPIAGLPGRVEATVSLRLVRSDQTDDPAALLTALELWAGYAATAPQVRLDRWQFAVAGDRRVLVHGRPLPPLRGQHLVDLEGLLVPAGWTWSPAVEPRVVRSALGLESGEFALWSADGSWERIPAVAMVRASRSGARMTAESFEHA
jgi:hypothetical protein